MKSSKKKKTKQPMSKAKKVVLSLVGIAAAVGIFYLAYYFIHYMWYGGYKKYLGSYEYEQGGAFTPVPEAKSDVPGYELVCENEFLKLYTDTKTANIAVYDKRDGSITYSNPQNPEEDSIANTANINYLKSQLVVQYYNADVRSSNYDSYSQSVAKGQYSTEGIANGIRYIYQIGDLAGAYVEVPLEYRLEQDKLVVSIPVSGISEYGDCYLYRVQLLRYMGAAHSSEDGYMVVPNGSGSLIYFNNGKTSADNYTQYIYDIDPMVSTYTTLENVSSAKLPVFGICRTDRSMLVTVEDGATTALITASVSGSYNDYNYVYPTFVLRNIDNLRMFGNSTTDVYVMEPDLYDINMQVSYAFPGEDYQGYAGLANYYRERLIAEGVLTPDKTGGDIPFYYDVIAGVKETAHFLGTQYLHTFSMTSFSQAKEMAEALSQDGITNQVMNLQGWFNGGYYHNAPHNIKVPLKLGGKSGLEKLEDAVNGLGGRLYVDVAFQRVTFADNGFNYNAESSRYYGSGYVAAFGQVNPTTLRNTSGLDYYETRYDLLSPKFLPRYVSKFVKKIKKYDVGGISLRDLGNVLTSDKKRTEIINREEALDVVLGQFELLQGTGKRLMTSEANAYSFAYSTDIINVPITDNSYAIVDESIPFYEMVIHGCISYSTELLNYEDAEDMTGVVLQMIEAGASPHYVFTWKDSSEMKDTGLNRYYATTFDTWKGEAVEIYNRVNEALKHVSGAMIVDHEILDGGVRKVTYDNGVIIYINYGSETQKVDGMEIPAMSYRMEGI
ncbi:MAG: hypothetical protein HDR11_14510 [Lachnospiraceae bacterium]|nr:hypothetical protein [Lachnospiraceae bacterium]MBD5498940.1 hypothetical protein [Lachnospiraceae bacterium]